MASAVGAVACSVGCRSRLGCGCSRLLGAGSGRRRCRLVAATQQVGKQSKHRDDPDCDGPPLLVPRLLWWGSSGCARYEGIRAHVWNPLPSVPLIPILNLAHPRHPWRWPRCSGRLGHRELLSRNYCGGCWLHDTHRLTVQWRSAKLTQRRRAPGHSAMARESASLLTINSFFGSFHGYFGVARQKRRAKGQCLRQADGCLVSATQPRPRRRASRSSATTSRPRRGACAGQPTSAGRESGTSCR